MGFNHSKQGDSAAPPWSGVLGNRRAVRLPDPGGLCYGGDIGHGRWGGRICSHA